MEYIFLSKSQHTLVLLIFDSKVLSFPLRVFRGRGIIRNFYLGIVGN